METVLAGEFLHTTRTEANNASGACSVYPLGKELHDKDERGSEGDAHVNHANHTCHRSLLSFNAVKCQAEYNGETEDLREAADPIVHRHR